MVELVSVHVMPWEQVSLPSSFHLGQGNHDRSQSDDLDKRFDDKPKIS